MKADDTWLGRHALCVNEPVTGVNVGMAVGEVVSVTDDGEYVQLQWPGETWVGSLWWRRRLRKSRPYWCKASDIRLLIRTKDYVENWYSADSEPYIKDAK